MPETMSGGPGWSVREQRPKVAAPASSGEHAAAGAAPTDAGARSRSGRRAVSPGRESLARMGVVAEVAAPAPRPRSTRGTVSPARDALNRAREAAPDAPGARTPHPAAARKDSFRHPVFARIYARVSPSIDRGGFGDLRHRLLGGVSGRVLEVGAGTGLNFAHYPSAVASVLAVEPEPHLRRLARQAAAAAPVPVTVVAGLADRLPGRNGAFDSVVVSLTLCSVPDQAAALAEIIRVLAPGGHLRFLEHVLAPTAPHRVLQRALDATIGPPFAGGCHTGRDTAAAIEAAGFRITWVERLRFPKGMTPVPTSPHILGSAVRP